MTRISTGSGEPVERSSSVSADRDETLQSLISQSSSNQPVIKPASRTVEVVKGKYLLRPDRAETGVRQSGRSNDTHNAIRKNPDSSLLTSGDQWKTTKRSGSKFHIFYRLRHIQARVSSEVIYSRREIQKLVRDATGDHPGVLIFLALNRRLSRLNRPAGNAVLDGARGSVRSLVQRSSF